MPGTFNEESFRKHLKTKELAKKIHYFSSVSSTNDMAKELAEQGAPHGTLVIAETQTRGRGRLGRTWFSPEGGLWFSLLVRTANFHLVPSHLNFIAGLSVAETSQRAGIDVALRWPNDIYIQGKKVGGILTESKMQGSVVEYFTAGIGLNVNVPESAFPAPLKEEAASFLSVSGKPLNRELLLAHILLVWEKLLEFYPAHGFAPILKIWKKYTPFLGTQVRVDTSSQMVEGEAVDVTLTGSLRVQDIDGLVHEISSGDVRKLWS